MGFLAQKLTVLGKPLFSVQLALFSAKCPKLRIFHTTGSCLGDNSEPESINRNYIYLTSGLSAGFSRTNTNPQTKSDWLHWRVKLELNMILKLYFSKCIKQILKFVIMLNV